MNTVKTCLLGLTLAAVPLAAVFWLLTAPWSGRQILELMERSYPQLTLEKCPEADVIAVLSGDGPPRSPAAIRPMDSPSRSEAGLALYQAGRAGYLLFTDGGEEGEQSREAAIRSGVPADRILVVSRAHDTAGEARLIAAAAHQRHWHHVILVTSGYHMARASMLLESAARRNGYRLTVTAFAADSEKFFLRSTGSQEYTPGANGIQRSSRWIREIAGQVVCMVGLC